MNTGTDDCQFELQGTIEFTWCTRKLALIWRIYTRPPNTTETVSLENIEHRPFQHPVILFEDGTQCDIYQKPFDANFLPEFVDHARSVVVNLESRRPAIRSGNYCWVIRRNGLRNELVRLLVGQGLVGDQYHTAYAVYQCRYSQGHATLTRAGILVVPTRNVYGAAEVPPAGLLFEREGVRRGE